MTRDPFTTPPRKKKMSAPITAKTSPSKKTEISRKHHTFRSLPTTHKDLFLRRVAGKIYAHSTLPHRGTFYFVFVDGPKDATSHTIHLTLYDNNTKTIRTYRPKPAFTAPRGSTASCTALDGGNNFLFKTFLFSLNENWTQHQLLPVDLQKSIVEELLSRKEHAMPCAVSTPSESSEVNYWYRLKASGGETIPIHRTVLESKWPEFKESLNARSLAAKLPEFLAPNTILMSYFPIETLRVFKRYFYGEELNMRFVDAARFVIFAHDGCYKYGLFDLCVLSERKLLENWKLARPENWRDTSVSVHDLFTLWESGWFSGDTYHRMVAMTYIRRLGKSGVDVLAAGQMRGFGISQKLCFVNDARLTEDYEMKKAILSCGAHGLIVLLKFLQNPQKHCLRMLQHAQKILRDERVLLKRIQTLLEKLKGNGLRLQIQNL